MTGFARATGHDGGLGWTWEVKSVNGRALDIRFRAPVGYDRLEAAARTALNQRFKRGSFTASLAVSRAAGEEGWRINRALLARLIELHDEFAGRVAPGAPRLDALLGVRGAVEQADESEDDAAAERRLAAIAASFETALEALAKARAAEGAQLARILKGQLDEIARLVTAAGNAAALRPDAVRARLKEQVAALIEAHAGFSAERLASEAVLIAAKADVREELDRLTAHLSAARELLAGPDAVGRRLDFLCQEFNREANTLCSKSSDIALTRIGLDLKAAIEQFREQVQNVE
jgi:uncharacterized protein (TIGR00255 family)